MAAYYGHYTNLEVDNLTLSGSTHITGMISGFVRSDISGKLYCSGGLTNADMANVNRLYSGTSTIGAWSVALGDSCLNSETISGATFNVGAGRFALQYLQDGDQNIAIGRWAGQNGLINSNNVLIGASAGRYITGGNDNIFIGNGAGGVSIGGNYNVAIGSSSLGSISGGTRNVAIGYTAGSAYNVNETRNICIGDGVVGIAGESNVCRIGLSGSVNATYVDNKIFEMGVATSISGTMTLSGTWLKGMIINTASGQVLTMPTGANIQAAYPYAAANQMFDVKLCNVGGNVNLSGNTNTTLFTPTNPLTTSTVLKLMCTASGSWNVYV